MAKKILVVGEINGNFDEVFDRVATVHQKNGPFHLLLCTGAFFSENQSKEDVDRTFAPYRNGEKNIAVKTYFACNRESIPQDVDVTSLCPNLDYLGDKGKHIVEGLTIVVSHSDETYEAEDSEPADVLLSDQWPLGFSNNLQEQSYQVLGGTDFVRSIGSKRVAETTVKMSPRYHFAPSISEVYYERAPFINRLGFATRFIALPVASLKTKQKWLYAANLVPASSMDKQALANLTPQDATISPFSSIQPPISSEPKPGDKRRAPDYDRNPRNNPSFRGGNPHQRGGDGGRRGRGSYQQQQQPQQPPQPCWFCLGTPSVEKHLIVSVGDSIYLALPKGGIVEDHVLIVPIRHATSIAALNKEEHQEVHKYKASLKNYFHSLNKEGVFFERKVGDFHSHIQVIPVPAGKYQVPEYFITEAKAIGFEFEELSESDDLQQKARNENYFCVEVGNRRLFHRIDKRHPAQFGRQVMAKMLGMEERVDWKACQAKSKDEEVALATQFKTHFSSFF
eukprot:TRINITY_DN9194_c0_g1_i1.p1 TRINITY_DN9194_c0_g1~~TRINITY_DN9194_c0_g1_i1.p1  ORF type:complete len:508 (+),score=89.16 TRINITY_DN9194_c0_g1_i1:86-1609(+)